MATFQEIKDAIDKKKEESLEDTMIRWSDIFMQRYGMNFEEFKSISIPTFINLSREIKRENDEMEKRMNDKTRLGKR